MNQLLMLSNSLAEILPRVASARASLEAIGAPASGEGRGAFARPFLRGERTRTTAAALRRIVARARPLVEDAERRARLGEPATAAEAAQALSWRARLRPRVEGASSEELAAVVAEVAAGGDRAAALALRGLVAPGPRRRALPDVLAPIAPLVRGADLVALERLAGEVRAEIERAEAAVAAALRREAAADEAAEAAAEIRRAERRVETARRELEAAETALDECRARLEADALALGLAV